MPPELLARLADGRFPLFHAINLGGLQSYVAARAVVCREDLLKDAATAPFRSDPQDRSVGILDRTFGNIYDFGAIYARAHAAATPNIYGVVQIVLSPELWRIMTDVVLTPLSVVNYGADWRKFAISDHEIGVMIDHARVNGGEVPRRFTCTEISCSNRALSLEACVGIIVEPLILDGKRLVDRVREIVAPLRLEALVQERNYTGRDKAAQIAEAADAAARLGATLSTRDLTIALPATIIGFDKMPSDKRGRFDQWAGNFYLDCVRPIAEEKAPLPDHESDAILEELALRDTQLSELRSCLASERPTVEEFLVEEISRMLADREVFSPLFLSDDGDGTIADYGTLDSCYVSVKSATPSGDSLEDVDVEVTFADSTFDLFVDKRTYWAAGDEDNEPDGYEVNDGDWSDHSLWAMYHGSLRVHFKAKINFSRGDADDLRFESVEVEEPDELEPLE